ncbi:inositol polyphosphate kinase [Toxoplasma gondii GAB2-2007-GAL-DOM2]|uniref:Kinase n=6 Tax=Toxoplasma gondii TaxID=5811 RepID=S7WDH3_TOXGG|nr:inositol polyphosphate kinase [Toxoplasma gondii GT1]KAF4642418.1 inositol polyphosphate kinase [Toxoplasma gondii]KFG39193.1 inositol polyphosphate kinase [Toxoplasma gondii GAB2-2007-GAL-DOM2]KFG54549.1 inositol polyphosphate kinase [Toxoplasma gondii FOU]KFH16819.1 inositol polyphosphate kinase [Toxoplasma gondii MAS]RQX75100.1 inositol polyphosphate kinase [Toxoplasma gondii CAST]
MEDPTAEPSVSRPAFLPGPGVHASISALPGGHVAARCSHARTWPTESEAEPGNLHAILAGGHSKNFQFSRDGLHVTKWTNPGEIVFYRWLYGLAGTPLAQHPSICHEENGSVSIESHLCDRSQNQAMCRNEKPSWSLATARFSGETSGANEQSPRQRRVSTDREFGIACSHNSEETEDASHFSERASLEKEWTGNAKVVERQARALKPWIPDAVCTSFATEEVSGGVPDESTDTAKAELRGDGRKRGILVLANILQGMRRPVIIDLKMGTRTYSDKASPEKRARAKRYAEERGSASLGMAFCGLSAQREDGTVVTVDGGSRAAKNYRHPKTLEDFVALLQSFLSFVGVETLRKDVAASLLCQLGELESVLEQFTIANFYGSSVLLAYDATAAADSSNVGGGVDARSARPQVKLVDFAHVTIMPENPDLAGLLFGLRHLQNALRQAAASSASKDHFFLEERE